MPQSLKLSEKIHYALLLCTALAQKYKNATSWMTLAEVAKRFYLSQGYCEEVVAHLRKAHIVKGRRGRHGGYRLAAIPKNISLAEIIEAIEGPTHIMYCKECRMQSLCRTEPIVGEIEHLVMSHLKKKTLADTL